MKILVANVGSTSLKYKLFDQDTVLAEGRVERIGDATSPQEHRIGERVETFDAPVPDYAAAVGSVVERLTDTEGGAIEDLGELDAVGFKTVHIRGGAGTLELTEDVLQRMADYNDLAPAHNPPYILAVRIFRQLYPDLPLIGLFEPAFHTTIPDYAYIYGVPYAWYENYGVRKYGFHGASHRYVAERVPVVVQKPADQLRIVSCHLGGSASLCAVRAGRSVDTTMGFSAQEGLINSTRNGAMDPFIIPFMMDRESMSTDDIRRVLTTESGLLGISGVSGDVRDLLAAADAGNDRARLALDAFCYGVRKGIAAMAAAAEGIDVIAFAGGIGERGAAVRERVCAGLGFLGAAIDPARNAEGPPERRIATDDSAIDIWVVPTNEELIVATAVSEYLAAEGNPN